MAERYESDLVTRIVSALRLQYRSHIHRTPPQGRNIAMRFEPLLSLTNPLVVQAELL
jgi:hypothetical protein